MTVLFMDGFDSYPTAGTPNGMLARWSASSTVNLGNMATGRVGGRCFDSHPSTRWWQSITGQTNLTVSMSVNLDGATSTPFLGGSFSGTQQWAVAMPGTDGSVTLALGGAVVQTSAPNKMYAGSWYTIEVEVVVHATTGRVSVYLEGEKILEQTNVNTATGGATCNRIHITGVTGNGASGLFDDFYILDTSTKPSKAHRIEQLLPNSDGATLNLVPSTGATHFGVVDEAVMSGTDYLSGSAVNDLDELGLSNLTSNPQGILAVSAIGYAAKSDVQTRAVKIGVKSGATVSEPSADLYLTTGGVRQDHLMQVDPNTGSTWSTAAVDALLIRPRVTV